MERVCLDDLTKIILLDCVFIQKESIFDLCDDENLRISNAFLESFKQLISSWEIEKDICPNVFLSSFLEKNGISFTSNSEEFNIDLKYDDIVNFMNVAEKNRKIDLSVTNFLQDHIFSSEKSSGKVNVKN